MVQFIALLTILNMAAPSQKEYNNKLADTEWKVNTSPFEYEAKADYVLTKKSDEVFDWGYSISFTESTFHSSYSAPCGNDCFTSVSGSYTYVQANTIEVTVERINRSGFCSEKSEENLKRTSRYEVNLDRDQITLSSLAN